jgi:iron complex transport system ATP-binding protein
VVTIATQALGVDLGGRRVLDAIDLSLSPGTLIGVVGPNGAGKSTLARALLGLVPYQGAVTIDGDEVSRLPPAAMAQRIAYLPQGAILHWPLSVERLVSLGRLPHLGPFSRVREADRVAIQVAMRDTDTLHLAERIATDLSGGERARVMLARALATGAPALVVDEPLASLDPGHQFEIMALLAARAAAGALVVLLLHDLSIAARFCGRLLLIDRGRLAADGPPAAVLTDRTLAEVYGITAWRGDLDGQPLLLPLARSRA